MFSPDKCKKRIVKNRYLEIMNSELNNEWTELNLDIWVWAPFLSCCIFFLCPTCWSVSGWATRTAIDPSLVWFLNYWRDNIRTGLFVNKVMFLFAPRRVLSVFYDVFFLFVEHMSGCAAGQWLDSNPHPPDEIAYFGTASFPSKFCVVLFDFSVFLCKLNRWKWIKL